MAETLPPGTPEVDDPLLVADLIRLLNIKGAIGRLPLADVVIPIVSLGDVVTPSINIRPPVFGSSNLFSEGTKIAAAVDTLHADTGPLPDGDFDLQIYVGATNTNRLRWVVEHRNATNTDSLAVWQPLTGAGGQSTALDQQITYSFAAGERLRIINRTTVDVAEISVAWIFARIRV